MSSARQGVRVRLTVAEDAVDARRVAHAREIPRPTRCEHMLRKSKQSGDFRVASIEMSTFYAVLGVRPHTVCNRNLDTRTGQGDLGS